MHKHLSTQVLSGVTRLGALSMQSAVTTSQFKSPGHLCTCCKHIEDPIYNCNNECILRRTLKISFAAQWSTQWQKSRISSKQVSVVLFLLCTCTQDVEVLFDLDFDIQFPFSQTFEVGIFPTLIGVIKKLFKHRRPDILLTLLFHSSSLSFYFVQSVSAHFL